MTALADTFEGHRDHLMGVAYRMLGSRADAEDAVQEAWLRYADQPDPAAIAEPRAWLTTVTARICLDVLRSARVRREAYVGPWLPEPIVARLADGGPDPAARVATTAEVGMALLAVLERLTPEQRLSFVLHDVFAVPFEQIALALGGRPEAARQLASRARRLVRDGAPRHTADRTEQAQVLAAFMIAAEQGDLAGLAKVLAPDVVLTSDGGGIVSAARRPVVGADRVARFYRGLTERVKELTLFAVVEVNGSLGLQLEQPAHGFRTVIALTVDNGLITSFANQLNPAKLARVARLDPAIDAALGMARSAVSPARAP